MTAVFKIFLLLGIGNGIGMLIGILLPTTGLAPTFGKVVVTVLLLFVGLAGYVVTKPKKTK